MRTLTDEEAAVYASGHAAHHVRVRVEVDGSWYDLSDLVGYDWLRGVEISEGIDQPVASATVRAALRLGGPDSTAKASPLVGDSSLNSVGGSANPLLQLAREFKIEVRLAPRGQAKEPVNLTEDPDDMSAASWTFVPGRMTVSADAAEGPGLLTTADLVTAIESGEKLQQTGATADGGEYSIRALVRGSASSQSFALKLLGATTGDISATGDVTITDDWQWVEASAGASTAGEALAIHLYPAGSAATGAVYVERVEFCHGSFPEWREVFHGRIDNVDPTGEVVIFSGRDMGGRLQDAWIQTSQVYGSDAGTLVDTVIQSILDDHAPAPVPTLNVIGSPAFAVKKYAQDEESPLSATQTLALSQGWDLRYRWDEASGSRLYTLQEPDRNAASVAMTLSPSQVLSIQSIATSLRNIRNRVRVRYEDSSDLDAAGVPKVKDVIVEDAASQTKYDGVRFMGLAFLKQIDTSTEATTLANAALADLKDPDVVMSIQVPALYAVELGDLLGIEPDGERFGTGIEQAVSTIRHVYEAGAATTTLGLRGKPAAAHAAWLKLEERNPVNEKTPTVGPLAPLLPSIHQVAGGFVVSFLPPLLGPRPADYELHVSTSSSFTPSDSTLKARSATSRFEVTDLPADTTYYAQVVPRDAAGNRGTASSEVNSEPGPTALDDDGNLRALLRQSDGVTARVLAKGHISGQAQDGDAVNFPVSFQNTPMVLLRGGLTHEPRDAQWVPGPYDTSAPTAEDVSAQDLDASGFTLRAKLVQRSAVVAFSIDADSDNNLLDALGETAEVTLASLPDGASGGQYTLHYSVVVESDHSPNPPPPNPPENGASIEVTLAIESSDDGVSWTERATATYSASGRNRTNTYAHEQKTVTVSGLSSDSPADQFRLKVKTVDTFTFGNGAVSFEAHLFSTGATPADSTGALTGTTATVNEASKTPDTGDYVYWEAIEVS